MSFPLVKRGTQAADNSRGPSASIWAPFNTADFARTPGIGTDLFQDFVYGTYPFYLWQDGSDSTDLHGAADVSGGIVRMSLTNDNEGAMILMRGQEEGIAATTALTRLVLPDQSGFLISDTAGATGMLGYEIRLRLNYTGNEANIFCGLIQPNIGGGITDITDASDVMVDIDYLGFEFKGATGNQIDVIYNKGGTAEFEVVTDVFDAAGAKGGGIVNTTANAIASSLGKWIKLGFLFDPDDNKRTDGSNKDRIHFFVNGEPMNAAHAVIDAGSSDPGIAATNFPDANGMVPAVVVISSGGTTITIDVDWIRVAQFHPSGSETAPQV